MKKILILIGVVLVLLPAGRFVYDKANLLRRVYKTEHLFEYALSPVDSQNHSELLAEFKNLAQLRFVMMRTYLMLPWESEINESLTAAYKKLRSLPNNTEESHIVQDYYYHIYGNCCLEEQSVSAQASVLERLAHYDGQNENFKNSVRYQLLGYGLNQLVAGRKARANLEGYNPVLMYFAYGLGVDSILITRRRWQKIEQKNREYKERYGKLRPRSGGGDVLTREQAFELLMALYPAMSTMPDIPKESLEMTQILDMYFSILALIHVSDVDGPGVFSMCGGGCTCENSPIKKLNSTAILALEDWVSHPHNYAGTSRASTYGRFFFEHGLGGSALGEICSRDKGRELLLKHITQMQNVPNWRMKSLEQWKRGK
ncbi:MAG: hypothetical protein OXR68_02435 [Alphaproteobacteria bacterium]|nr:hypothetical protein [Alphaproteobacteria bacterium]MDD9919466.1 hypothetical protein [Alphaproteobacteria bacterium]